MEPDNPETERPVWIPDEECSSCSDCTTYFTIVNRRHHCRLCGYIFCESCSSVRITNITGPSDKQFHRICNQCGDELEEENLVVEIPASTIGPSFLCGVRPNKVLACINHAALQSVMLDRPNSSVRTILGSVNESESIYSLSSNSSILTHCPVCSKRLKDISREKAQMHVSECLDKRRSSVVGSQYIANTLDVSLEGKECGICFEKLLKGQRCAVLNCLCQFHQKCIDDWFEKKKTCPVHYA